MAIFAIFKYVFAHQKKKKSCGNKNLEIRSRTCVPFLFFFVRENKYQCCVLAFLSSETQKNAKVQNMFSKKYFYGNFKKNKNPAETQKNAKLQNMFSMNPIGNSKKMLNFRICSR